MVTDDSLEVEYDESDDLDYTRYDIASYPTDLTLNGVREMWNTNAIVIPSFQRNFVWTIKQASLLIDSFLCGLPVPPVFFYITDDNNNLVIDGQQRILSIVYFLDGYYGDEDSNKRKRVFRLHLPEKHPYNNKSFSEIEDADQKKLLHFSVLRAINIRQLRPEDNGTSAYHIFERLNTGGTPLSPQEIRNCIFIGPFVSVLKSLNEDESWRKILGKDIHDKHQKDVELILRVFSLFGQEERYEKPMKEFLNINMKKHKTGDTTRVKKFMTLFPVVAKLIVTTFGAKPFHLRGPLNTSALDAVMSVLIDNYENVPGDIKKRFKQLLRSDEFNETTKIGGTDVRTLAARFSVTKKILIEQ